MKTGIAFGIVALGLPFLLDDTQMSVYVLMGLAVLAVTGISLLMGYAGQVSLGQAAFYAVGAYTAAVPAVHGWPPVVGLVLAPVVAAGVAALLGALLLRLRGHYLAFATLALQLIILSVAAEIDVFGGAIGLQGIPLLGVGSFSLEAPREYAWLTWVAVCVVLVLTANIVASRPGRALRALAGSEQVAAASGIPVIRYKVTVFALSAAYAGLAGGIYAFFLGYIAPGSFTIAMSVEWVVMAVFGGLGTRWGPVVGTVAVTLVVQVLNDLSTRPGAPSYAPTVLGYAAYAVLLIGVLLFMPGGVVPASTRIGDRGPVRMIREWRMWRLWFSPKSRDTTRP
ncbi:branched-chain amino acid ABC transporter permease [Cryptosporangium phraense]|uniref:Branched-chain amino acid ABC transporter permease n=1 Tax=Cryptosporangium phraense TaxID=2593070 RepID=A0A545AVT2_9ACTN|nr:branched-chain amino acid ABC transporter permease [Cryptosporangium phraense]TQS45452.1 branched-chain amino acid ABC transporter permease [Cryptosporangium phraense]